MLLWSVLFPLILSLALFFIAAKRRAVAPGQALVIQGLAWLPGLWVPYISLMDWPGWPPRDATQWLLWLTPLVLITVVVQNLLTRSVLATCVKVLALALMAYGVLQAPILNEWRPGQSAAIVA